jgi:hypothetical protein
LPKTLHDRHHFRHPLLLGLERGLLSQQLRVLGLEQGLLGLQLGLQYFTPMFQ